MIISHRFFELNGKRLIERLEVKAPFKYGAVLGNEACLLYLQQGHTNLLSPNGTIVVASHEAVILKCGAYFSEFMARGATNQCVVFAVHLYPDILKDIYGDGIPSFIKQPPHDWQVKKMGHSDVVARFIDSLAFYFDNPSLVSTDLLKLKLQELILLLLNTNNADTLWELFAQVFTPRQAELSQVVQAHLFSSVTIAEMAALAGRSLSSFKREFLQVYHQPPASYLREKRLERAGECLAHTDLPIADICYRLGFSNTAHFSRLFKSKFHDPPLAYRKKALVNQTGN